MTRSLPCLTSVAAAAAVVLALAVVVAPQAAADEPKPWAAAETAVASAERDPDKIPAAKDAVTAAVAANPAAVGPRLLGARLALADALVKKGDERKAAFQAALAALDQATAIDVGDPDPFRLKGDVYRAMGAGKDEVAEALRAVSIRVPDDEFARDAYRKQAGKVPPLLPGDPLPPVVWKDGGGRDVPATSLVGAKVLVIELYRSAVWCPFCQKRLFELHDNADKIAAEDAVMVAASPDTGETIAAIEKDGLKGRKPFRLRLLSDPKGTQADRLGLLNPDTVKAGVRPEAFGLPYPTTIIADEKGIVRFVDVHLDFRDRTKIDVMLAEIRKAHAPAVTPR